MDPITINVQVNVGVTPELASLVKPIVDHLQGARAVEAAPAAPQPETKPASKKTKQQPAADPAPEAPAATAETTQEQPAAAAEVSNQEEAPAAAPAAEQQAEAAAEEKNYTEEDVRAAMDRTRKRIEGEDYKYNTTSDGYKTWHRKLTAQFKQIAGVLGSDKPSTLPSSELRGSFIRQCDELEIGEEGSIVTKCPF